MSMRKSFYSAIMVAVLMLASTSSGNCSTPSNSNPAKAILLMNQNHWHLVHKTLSLREQHKELWDLRAGCLVTEAEIHQALAARNMEENNLPAATYKIKKGLICASYASLLLESRTMPGHRQSLNRVPPLAAPIYQSFDKWSLGAK